MTVKNEINILLGTKFPILQGGMAWASSAKLACSVSEAGGLGIIGCAGRNIDWVLKEINWANKNSTIKVGLNVALNDENAEEIVEVAVKNDIKFFTMGGANTYLKLIKRYGDDVLIIPLVGSVNEAKFAERAGAKLIICEGQESGGSIGRLSLFSLLPQVVDAVKIPVIAAGGIADGRGMKAAFALGAKGIQMGTRFLASEECDIIQDYKRKIVKAKDVDSMVISNRIKRPTRVIKNKFAVDYLAKEQQGIPEFELSNLVRGKLKMAVESDADSGAMHAGEIAGLIKEIKCTRDIILDIILDFNKVSYDYFNDDDSINSNVSKYLKHLPPILLIDEIICLSPGYECKSKLTLTENKWFFKCHYPDYPVMPGTLLVEAMSQTMVIAINSQRDIINGSEEVVLLNSIKNAKFLKEAVPGMEIVIHAKVNSFKRGVVKGSIRCESNNELLCFSEQTIIVPGNLPKIKEI